MDWNREVGWRGNVATGAGLALLGAWLLLLLSDHDAQHPPRLDDLYDMVWPSVAACFDIWLLGVLFANRSWLAGTALFLASLLAFPLAADVLIPLAAEWFQPGATTPGLHLILVAALWSAIVFAVKWPFFARIVGTWGGTAAVTAGAVAFAAAMVWLPYGLYARFERLTPPPIEPARLAALPPMRIQFQPNKMEFHSVRPDGSDLQYVVQPMLGPQPLEKHVSWIQVPFGILQTYVYAPLPGGLQLRVLRRLRTSKRWIQIVDPATGATTTIARGREPMVVPNGLTGSLGRAP